MKLLYTYLAASMLMVSAGYTNAQNLFKDLWPGTNDGFPYYLTPTADYMLFRAESPVSGRELWITDGTTSGTTMLKDINSGPGNSSPYELFEFNGKVLFTADNNVNGSELWISDGTASGTKLLKDIYPGGNWSDSKPYGFARIGNEVVFTAQISSFQYEPMITDGTTSGTRLLKDIYPGTAGSLNDLYSRYTENMGELYFVAVNDVHGQELWKTDGTTNGTRLVKDIASGLSYGVRFETPMISYNNEVYFAANNGNGEELWKSDGTPTGTVQVKDINPGTGGSSISDFCIAGGKLYFRADDGSTGRELWVTDGTASGTKLVKDIYPGPGNGSPNYLTEFQGKVYFSASGLNAGREVWVSDGTAAGTKLFYDFYYLGDSNPGGFFSYGGLLYVSVSIPNIYGRETWVIDGDSANTKILKDIWPGTASSVSSLFTPFNGFIFMQATSPNEGTELWAYDPCSTLSIDNTITAAADSLFSNATNVDYQWIYCGGKDEIRLQDEDNAAFYPQLSGNYRVELSGGGCVTSSNCIYLENKPVLQVSPDSTFFSVKDSIANATYQWYDCDSMANVNGATQRTFQPTESRKFRRYAVIVTHRGIRDTSLCGVLQIQNSLEELKNTGISLQVYPNPSKKQFTVKLNKSNSEAVEFVLSDLQGRELSKFTSDESQVEIDMANYSSGIYFLKARTASSGTMIKLIKED